MIFCIPLIIQDDLEKKRGHVLAELLDTERIYVAEMGSILKVSIIDLHFLKQQCCFHC